MSECLMMRCCTMDADGGSGLCARHYANAFPTDEDVLERWDEWQRRRRARHDENLRTGVYREITEAAKKNQQLGIAAERAWLRLSRAAEAVAEPANDAGG